MSFRKGSKVEVLNKREVSTGSWWHAEIISRNGRVYSVRYDHPPPGICDASVERVPRKSIRPCPPALKLSCVPGDMIDVFHGGSWKITEVLRVLDGNNFSVRLLGSSQAFNIHLSKLRLRQAWEDNKWVVIKKNISRFCGGILPGPGETGSCEEYQNEVMCGNINSRRYVSLLGSCSMCGKRKSESLLLPNLGNAQNTKKHRATQKDFGQQQLFVGRNICSKNGMGRSETETKCQKMKANVVFPVGRSSEDDNLESDACSTCSSSGSNYPDVSSGCGGDLDDRSDNVHSIPTDAEVHEKELHAYCAMMKALYASGPISWEQEALLTSHRLLLHISNDEHLSVLRHLLSGPDLGAVKFASKVQDDDRGLTTLLSLGSMRQLPIIFTMLGAHRLLDDGLCGICYLRVPARSVFHHRSTGKLGDELMVYEEIYAVHAQLLKKRHLLRESIYKVHHDHDDNHAQIHFFIEGFAHENVGDLIRDYNVLIFS